MVRQRRNEEDEFSLFPFLDALSGVIGILALIIAIMAILGLHESRIITSQWTSEHGLKPVFVECCQTGLVIHPEKTNIDISELESQPWKDLKNEVRNSGTKYIVFLIRPDGIESFATVQEKLPESIQHSFDVIDSETSLDFS